MSNLLRFIALILLSLSGDILAAPAIGGCPVFPSNNYWNTPVDALPVHASSTTWVNSIGATTNLHPDWGNVLADNYGIPFITVNASQGPVGINFSPDGYGDESDPGPMPIPTTAPVEGGASSDGDRHVIAVDTSHCILYELYYAFPASAGWTVYSAAKYDLNSNALRTAGWTSADAAGLPIFPGLVRWDEIAAGEIAHAIRFTANNIWARNNGQPEYLWPARHWSGSSSDSSRPPMGARFRLKSSFDITHFSSNTQVILRAFKKYGIVLADGGSNWYFQGVSDTRFPDALFDELKSIAGSNFEAVDTSVMQVDPNTAEAQQSGTSTPASVNVQGLWWNAPANSESGWGINLTQQGDVLFATWFTYDTDGSGLWLVMSNGAKTAANTYTGALYRTTGPAFNATPWLTGGVNAQSVGTATFTFTDGNTGTFASVVNGFTQTKSIVREPLYPGQPMPTCTEGATPGSNYQGLWWNSNESGWGVNVTHQADTLFATWFTYDLNGKGLWLVMSNGAKTAPGSYTGGLYRTTGPAYNVPFSSGTINATQVGTATFTFSGASTGTFAYSVNGVSQSKAVTRELFAPSPTACN